MNGICYKCKKIITIPTCHNFDEIWFECSFCNGANCSIDSALRYVSNLKEASKPLNTHWFEIWVCLPNSEKIKVKVKFEFVSLISAKKEAEHLRQYFDKVEIIGYTESVQKIETLREVL